MQNEPGAIVSVQDVCPEYEKRNRRGGGGDEASPPQSPSLRGGGDASGQPGDRSGSTYSDGGGPDGATGSGDHDEWEML